MRLNAKKTWSQHQLAAKLRMERGGKQGLLTFERQRLLIDAAKTALAAALCWWLALRFGLHDGYWGSISAIIVLQSNVGATVSASRDRILGTLIGVPLGILCMPISVHVPPLAWMLAAVAMIVYAMALPDRYDIACGAYAFTLMVTLAISGETTVSVLAARGWETLIGGALGVAAAKFVSPLPGTRLLSQT